ncbi:MAG: hypothetical protein HLUCCO16_07560, partial [Phormidium sp. OSCR]
IFDMFAIHQHWERARHLRFAPTAIYGMNFEKWYQVLGKENQRMLQEAPLCSSFNIPKNSEVTPSSFKWEPGWSKMG